MNAPCARNMPDCVRGFTLVELMVAMVLGLLVIGAVIGVFLSNQQVNRQNEAIARMQESARYAFEVMARDIREAGGVACGKLDPVNVLNDPTSYWWANWEGGAIRGFAGDDNTFPKAFAGSTPSAGDRVSGTDALIILSGTANDGLYITDHNPTSAQFKVNTTAHGIVDGDILLVCDHKHAAIFQTTNANSSNVTIVHNTGSSVSPGNCTKGLGSPRECTANGTPYTFAKGGFIAKLSATGWYIGHNGRGGRSLYRLKLQNNSGTAATSSPEEIAEGITDLQIKYLVRDTNGTLDTEYRDSPKYQGSGSEKWDQVVATRLTLTLQTLEQVGTNIQPIQRNWYTVISLRSRLP